MADTTTLKPCPFCGGQAGEKYIKRKKFFAKLVFPYSTHFVFIRCGGCEASTSMQWTREDAINAWNRRVNDG